MDAGLFNILSLALMFIGVIGWNVYKGMKGGTPRCLE
jgi:hypothetical protein